MGSRTSHGSVQLERATCTGMPTDGCLCTYLCCLKPRQPNDCLGLFFFLQRPREPTGHLGVSSFESLIVSSALSKTHQTSGDSCCSRMPCNAHSGITKARRRFVGRYSFRRPFGSKGDSIVIVS